MQGENLKEELRGRLEAAILALPKHYRLVLILRDMEQLDTREVAEVMGISEETTKMRPHRARVFVRNALAGYVRQHAPGRGRAKILPNRHCKRIFAILSD